ncbi:MAG TPA: putative collagen-binding domain-containing protein [Tepidisphaeraceae bacterium]|nr:putative collagen-binding domain-containing protein [Tepidisphaeraceae bacterium]
MWRVWALENPPQAAGLKKLSGAKMSAWWYDPRTGKTSHAEDFEKVDKRQFTPPTNGPGNVWVLVLDDVSRDFPPPGTIVQ